MQINVGNLAMWAQCTTYLHVRIKVSEIALGKQSFPLVMEGLTERSEMSDCHKGM